jgi:5-formyltetrahydrofolate cyclo-ligase
MSIDDDKHALRKRYRAIRSAIPEIERVARSDRLAQQLLALPVFEQASSVFVYVSSGSEVQTLKLIAGLLGQGKTIAVPRVLPEPGVMQPIVFDSLDDFAPGRFGILEPTTHEALAETPDITIVPGLAFTATGGRLGQGGGYYDRYLAQHPTTHTIGLCFMEQLVETLPIADNDIPMDEVMSA